jgi:hypothetical protein
VPMLDDKEAIQFWDRRAEDLLGDAACVRIS